MNKSRDNSSGNDDAAKRTKKDQIISSNSNAGQASGTFKDKSGSSSSSGSSNFVHVLFERIWVLKLVKRISFWTCIISVIAYWDNIALHGKFVYDDAGSVSKNVIVNGQVPWTEVFIRDFWGTLMEEPQSHKSYRPITTLSFRLNWLYNEHYSLIGTDDETYAYHVVNVILHGINTMLATEASKFIFSLMTTPDNNTININIASQLITGLLFGLHPVHSEAVSNITSRGELLMSFFFFCAFLSFANSIDYAYSKNINTSNNTSKLQKIFEHIFTFTGIYIIPWICMTLSLFSKEQGATTLISLVIYDFVHHFTSVQDYFKKVVSLVFKKSNNEHDNKQLQQAKTNIREKKNVIMFFIRTIILAIETLLCVGLRYHLNGETTPDFIRDQNPAAFSDDFFTRIFSITWVYCLYIVDAILPIYLCPDWSGKSIDLITTTDDYRIIYVLILWYFFFDCCWNLLFGYSSLETQTQQLTEQQQVQKKRFRRVLLISFFSFLFSPFLLSSNILVKVGLMKADRVIYLPLFGFCLLEAQLFQSLCSLYHTNSNKNNLQNQQEEKNDKKLNVFHTTNFYFIIGYLLIMMQLCCFTCLTHERNIAWSDSVILWTLAYNVNPRSHHTMYNCGYELSLKQRYKEAERVMKPIGNARVDGPSNTFVYSMILYNLDRCDEANEYIDIAMEVLDEKKKDVSNPRNQPSMLARTESNLLVARGYCAQDDVKRQGRILRQAVKTDPRNTYAVNQLKAYMEKMKTLEKLKQEYGVNV